MSVRCPVRRGDRRCRMILRHKWRKVVTIVVATRSAAALAKNWHQNDGIRYLILSLTSVPSVKAAGVANCSICTTPEVAASLKGR